MTRRVWIGIFGGLLLVDMAAVTVHRALGGEPWERCLSAPAACAGQSATLTLYRVKSLAGAEATLQRGDHQLRVVGVPPDAQPGAEVSLQGTYRADGSVGVVAWYPHPGRPAKRWLGVVGLFVALLLPFVAFVPRFTGGRWALGARWPTW